MVFCCRVAWATALHAVFSSPGTRSLEIRTAWRARAAGGRRNRSRNRKTETRMDSARRDRRYRAARQKEERDAPRSGPGRRRRRLRNGPIIEHRAIARAKPEFKLLVVQPLEMGQDIWSRESHERFAIIRGHGLSGDGKQRFRALPFPISNDIARSLCAARQPPEQ